MPQKRDDENDVSEGSFLEAREARLISDTKTNEVQLNQTFGTSDLIKKPFSQRMKTSRYWPVRGVFYIFYSVWMIAMGIGIAIAWLVAMLFI